MDRAHPPFRWSHAFFHPIVEGWHARAPSNRIDARDGCTSQYLPCECKHAFSLSTCHSISASQFYPCLKTRRHDFRRRVNKIHSSEERALCARSLTALCLLLLWTPGFQDVRQGRLRVPHRGGDHGRLDRDRDRVRQGDPNQDD